eukprot:Nk52_evm16s277 gene=Nk52_evmTU16s277
MALAHVRAAKHLCRVGGVGRRIPLFSGRGVRDGGRVIPPSPSSSSVSSSSSPSCSILWPVLSPWRGYTTKNKKTSLVDWFTPLPGSGGGTHPKKKSGAPPEAGEGGEQGVVGKEREQGTETPSPSSKGHPRAAGGSGSGGGDHSQQTLSNLQAMTFNYRGDLQWAEFSKKDFSQQMRLQPRDLRMLEFRSQQASVLVRPAAILVNLGLIRAVVKHDIVVLFDPFNPGIQLLIHEMQERLRVGAEQQDPLPYEFRALETMLINVCASIDSTMQEIRPSINEILSKLTEVDSPDIDKKHLLLLLRESKRLTAFETRANEIKIALNDILESEEDMAGMYLTTKAATGHARRIDQHEEVEMLFENYLKRVEEIANEASQLKLFIKDTEDIVNINLDSQRNTMMRLDLQMTMGNFSVGICGLAAAAFGMNLTSHLEESSSAFMLVSGGIMVGVGSMWLQLLRYGRKRNIW